MGSRGASGAASLLVTPGDWSEFLYGLIAKRAAGLFRLSEFSLRLPGIVGCLLFCYALMRICRSRIWVALAFALPAALLNWFNLAGGAGLSIGLMAIALAHPGSAGLSLGLAVAACPQIGFVPASGSISCGHRRLLARYRASGHPRRGDRLCFANCAAQSRGSALAAAHAANGTGRRRSDGCWHITGRSREGDYPSRRQPFSGSTARFLSCSLSAAELAARQCRGRLLPLGSAG